MFTVHRVVDATAGEMLADEGVGGMWTLFQIDVTRFGDPRRSDVIFADVGVVALFDFEFQSTFEL